MFEIDGIPSIKLNDAIQICNDNKLNVQVKNIFGSILNKNSKKIKGIDVMVYQSHCYVV